VAFSDLFGLFWLYHFVDDAVCKIKHLYMPDWQNKERWSVFGAVDGGI